MSDALIVNASPLIFLGNAGRLDLLRTADTTRIIVPHEVVDEVMATEHDDRASRALAETEWIERTAAIDIPPRSSSGTSDRENPLLSLLLLPHPACGQSSMIFSADGVRSRSD
jgi:hypothetical protein